MLAFARWSHAFPWCLPSPIFFKYIFPHRFGTPNDLSLANHTYFWSQFALIRVPVAFIRGK